jgi:hypothetical protein
MTIQEYISSQPEDRQLIMTELHEAIMANDKTVTPNVEPMMGKEMIIYKEGRYMKYGLAGMKNYMSVHCLPIYGHPALYAKYAGLLPAAKFQKGCINFTNAAAMRAKIASNLFADCAVISIADMLAKRKRK